MIQNPDDPLDYIDPVAGSLYNKAHQNDLISDLLYQIIRVRDLVKYYENIPNGAGSLGASILSELVSEAYKSLVDYDTVLMKKYYELLLNCD